MEEIRIAGIVMVFFLISLTSNFASLIAHASSTPTFYVDPSGVVDQNLTPGSSFTVNVRVSDAVGLNSWQVCMVWDIGELNVMDIAFGDFLAGQPEGTYAVSRVVNEEGFLLVGEVTLGAYPGVDGDGWLFSVIFSVEAFGETIIDISSGHHLAQTFYINSEWNVIGDEPGELVKQNGYFSNLGGLPATIEELKAEIQEQSSQGRIDNYGIASSLIANLNTAQKLVDKGKIDEAKAVLAECFIPKVQSLSGIHITVEAADILIKLAEYIMSHL